MPSRRSDWLTRLRRCETDAVAAVVALERLADESRSDPTLLTARDGLSPANFANAVPSVRDSLFVAMVATFEFALREYWSNARGRGTEPPLRDLINSAASDRSVPDAFRHAAHRVRKQRNAAVHDGESPTDSMRSARSALARFLSYLPDDWPAA